MSAHDALRPTPLPGVPSSAARCLNDLQIPPGNRLEPLRGNRYCQQSIRINDQFHHLGTWAEMDFHSAVQIAPRLPFIRAGNHPANALT